MSAPRSEACSNGCLRTERVSVLASVAARVPPQKARLARAGRADVRARISELEQAFAAIQEMERTLSAARNPTIE